MRTRNAGCTSLAQPCTFSQTASQRARSPLAVAIENGNEVRAMPPQRSDIHAPAAAADPGAADCDPRALAAAATNGDAVLKAAFWRARAEELQGRLTRMEDRLRALGERLPSRWAQLLACDPADLPELAHWPDPLAGWRETTELESARVASALPRLWDRLDPSR